MFTDYLKSALLVTILVDGWDKDCVDDEERVQSQERITAVLERVPLSLKTIYDYAEDGQLAFVGIVPRVESERLEQFRDRIVGELPAKVKTEIRIVGIKSLFDKSEPETPEVPTKNKACEHCAHWTSTNAVDFMGSCGIVKERRACWDSCGSWAKRVKPPVENPEEHDCKDCAHWMRLASSELIGECAERGSKQEYWGSCDKWTVRIKELLEAAPVTVVLEAQKLQQAPKPKLQEKGSCQFCKHWDLGGDRQHVAGTTALQQCCKWNKVKLYLETCASWEAYGDTRAIAMQDEATQIKVLIQDAGSRLDRETQEELSEAVQCGIVETLEMDERKIACHECFYWNYKEGDSGTCGWDPGNVRPTSATGSCENAMIFCEDTVAEK